MAIVLKDRVKETTNTTGTSDFVLGGTSSGYQNFSVIGANNYTYYCCYDQTTGDWEVGYGQYTTTAGGTLVRNTVLSNSAATTNKINFAAGPKDLFITYPAEKSIYEEIAGNVLIDGGPITVIGTGVTGYTTFTAALGEMYADVDSFAQFYAQNLNDGSEASADFVAYNDLGDGANNFVDVGINSSNYSSATYPIFTPGSAYAFNDGGEMFVGSATDDLVLFAGGTDVADEAVRIDKTTKLVTTAAGLTLGGALAGVGASFTSAVTTTASMASPATTEFVTREYVDNATSNGFHVHTPVLVATTGNLTATYNQPGGAGVGVGATLTNSGTQVALSIDGVSLSVNNRVLVWQQTTGLQNGIYVVTTVGSGSTNWVLTRASDANTSSEGDPNTLGGGDYFFVQSGTTLGYHSYICTNTAAIVFGSTAITFNEFSSVPQYTGGTNISVSGNVISLTGTVAATNGGTGTATVTTGDLLYGAGTNTWGKLAAGAAYKSLVMNAGGTNVEWNAVALNQSGAVSGALPATNGGTGITAYNVGEMVYANTSTTLDVVTRNTTTTKKFLSQTGTGTSAQAPVWEQPAASDITGLAPSATTDTTNASNITSGTLPSGRLSGSYTGITGVGTLTAGTWNASTVAAIYGGTGLTSFTAGDLLYADTSTTIARLADVAVGNALISGGVSANPSWGKIGLDTHVTGILPVANGGTGNTTNQAASVANAITFNTTGGAAAGTTYNGSTARTIDFSTVGASPLAGSSSITTVGTITSGTWTGTAIAVANGGTGATTAPNARTNLGLVIGTDVQAYSANLAAIAGLAPTLDNFIVGNGTTWILETPAQARASLGGTTVGQNFFTLTNPAAITFPRINADNTVSALDAATFRTAIGAGTGSGTVTSVTGTSPVVSSGGATPAISLASGYGDTQNPYASKTANQFLAAPNGTAGAPTFRAIVAADIPTLNQNTTGTASNITSFTINQSVGTANNVQFNSLGVGTAGSGTAGEFRATNNVTAYFSSDIKFKENVVPITGATAIIKAIGADYFDWTDAYIAEHGGEDGYFVQKQDFGVIAQKVQPVFPKAVRTRPDGSLAVDYEKLGVLAFAALIEQDERIARLEALVAKLTKD